MFKRYTPKSMVMIFVVLLLGSFVVGCGAFPNEAKQALDEWVRKSMTPETPYSIVSAQKATNLQFWLYSVNQFEKYQEVWCVVIDKGVTPQGVSPPSERHFLLGKTGLLWDVLLSFYDESTDGKKFFLGLGCNNW